MSTPHTHGTRSGTRSTAGRRLRRAAVTATALALAVVAGPVSGATAAPVDAWTSEFGGAGNATNNPGESVITPKNAPQLTQAWSANVYAGAHVAPAVVDGVAYHVVNPSNTNDPSTLTGTDVRTGATLGTASLPGKATYHRGLTVVDGVVVLPFDGAGRPGGVLAFDVASRTIRWTWSLPASSVPGTDNRTTGQLTVDGGRVYVSGAGNTVNALRLSDGAPLWTLPSTSTVVRGMTAANGVVYTGGNGGVIAYSGATGQRLWSAPGQGAPVVAGGRVFSADGSSVVAVSATGCGQATCPALWRRDVGLTWSGINVGGANAATLFLTYTRGDGRSGVIERLAAGTGALQWSAPLDPGAGQPVRAGNTVWLIANAKSLVGFSATATGTKPLRVLTEPVDRQGALQGIAVSGGTVLVQSWPAYLTGYRVPGT